MGLGLAGGWHPKDWGGCEGLGLCSLCFCPQLPRGCPRAGVAVGAAPRAATTSVQGEPHGHPATHAAWPRGPPTPHGLIQAAPGGRTAPAPRGCPRRWLPAHAGCPVHPSCAPCAGWGGTKSVPSPPKKTLLRCCCWLAQALLISLRAEALPLCVITRLGSCLPSASCRQEPLRPGACCITHPLLSPGRRALGTTAGPCRVMGFHWGTTTAGALMAPPLQRAQALHDVHVAVVQLPNDHCVATKWPLCG